MATSPDIAPAILFPETIERIGRGFEQALRIDNNLGMPGVSSLMFCLDAGLAARRLPELPLQRYAAWAARTSLGEEIPSWGRVPFEQLGLENALASIGITGRVDFELPLGEVEVRKHLARIETDYNPHIALLAVGSSQKPHSTAYLGGYNGLILLADSCVVQRQEGTLGTRTVTKDALVEEMAATGQGLFTIFL